MAKKAIAARKGCAQRNKQEIWMPVPSEPGMMASSLGRIILPPRYAPLKNGGYRTYLPKPRYGCVCRAKKTASHAYMNIMVRCENSRGRQAPKKVHRLVCEAFHGKSPFDRAVVIHVNEDGLDNRPENLRWGTQKENLNSPGFREYCSSRRRVGIQGGGWTWEVAT